MDTFGPELNGDAQDAEVVHIGDGVHDDLRVEEARVCHGALHVHSLHLEQ